MTTLPLGMTIAHHRDDVARVLATLAGAPDGDDCSGLTHGRRAIDLFDTSAHHRSRRTGQAHAIGARSRTPLELDGVRPRRSPQAVRQCADAREIARPI